MADTVNQTMLDFQVSQAVRMHRLATGKIMDMRKISARVDDALRTLLAGKDFSHYNLAQIALLTEAVRSAMSAIYKDTVAPEITSYAQDVAELSATTEANLLRRTL